MPTTPATIIFDVNETLLDLAPLRASVGDALGGRPDLLPLWFTTMLHYSLVDTLNDDYRDFADVGVAALMMTGERNGMSITRSEARSAVAGPIRALPAHPDVRPALQRLSGAGFRLATLTNSSAAGVDAQLRNAGLIDLFDDVMSTQAVRAFKPDRRTYQHALVTLNTDAADVLMVAAHAWDLAGAKKSGLRTAFVRRSGATLYPNVDAPDYSIADLTELADFLIEEESDRA